MASECILVPCYKRLSRAVSIACLLGFLVPLSILSNTLSALPLDSQKNIQLPQIYTIEVVNVYPHDPRAFTEVSINYEIPLIFFNLYVFLVFSSGYYLFHYSKKTLFKLYGQLIGLF